jgi:hypothetical protein
MLSLKIEHQLRLTERAKNIVCPSELATVVSFTLGGCQKQYSPNALSKSGILKTAGIIFETKECSVLSEWLLCEYLSCAHI